MLYLPTTPGSIIREVPIINDLNDKNIIKYGNKFDDDCFWAKLWKSASSLGEEGVYLLLLLYYALKSNIPASIKLIIIGAICWFLIPMDAIPDFVPVAGYADDLAALMFAKHKAEQYIDASVSNKAHNKLKELKEVTL